MRSLIRKSLGPEDLADISSSYLTEGRVRESWEILNVDIEHRKVTAHVGMVSTYISETDSGGFHLTIFSALEFLSQLAIIYTHVWGEEKKKTREAWMIECTISSKRPIREPNNIRVDMDVRAIRKMNGRYLLTADFKVFDSFGLFEGRLKGFFS